MARIEMKLREGNKIRALNGMATTAMQERDLELLNSIEETIDALSVKREQLDFIASGIEKDVESVSDVTEVIDAEGVFVPMIEKTRDKAGKLYDIWSSKCDAARNAPELTEDDGVVEAYCEALDALARLHNALNAWAWAIREHDADLEAVVEGGPHKTAEDLFRALGV